MKTSLVLHLERASDELQAAVCDDLVARRGSAFAAFGALATRRLVARFLAALQGDVEHGGVERIRRIMKDTLSDAEPAPLGWHDLRLLLMSVRSALLSRLDAVPELPRAATRALEDLLLRIAFDIGLRFITQREEVIEAQAVELERRLAELDAGYAEQSRLLEQAQQLSARYDTIVGNMQGVIWEARFNQRSGEAESTFISTYIETLTGYTTDEWESMTQPWLSILHPEDRPRILEETKANIRAGGGTYHARWVKKDGEVIHVEIRMSIVKDAAGAPVGVRGITIDVTARELAREGAAQARKREEVIQRQAERLAELSTPLIPISDKVMVMPLIGSVDAERAQRVIETLLGGIERTGASAAILDITGVRSVDSHTADLLLQAARAARLLGAELLITGIRPEVAQIFVHLGIDLSGIITAGTLQSGIAHAMARYNKLA